MMNAGVVHLTAYRLHERSQLSSTPACQDGEMSVNLSSVELVWSRKLPCQKAPVEAFILALSINHSEGRKIRMGSPTI